MNFLGCQSQTRQQIIEKRCVIPQKPIYKKIEKNMPTTEKFSVLLDNLAKQKAYVSKLKSTIECFNEKKEEDL